VSVAAETALGGVLVLALAATAFLPRVTVRGQAVHLFRAFFPSWRFFEDVGPAPRLMHRRFEAGPGGAPGPWTDTVPPVPRGPLALLYNPAGNLRLACGSLVDQLVADLDALDEAALARGELDALDALVSYRLVRRLVEQRRASEGEDAGAWQFRLVLDEPAQTVVFQSPVFDDPAAAP
jgi:hypothetical protein